PPSGSSDFRDRHVNSDVRLAADWNFAPGWQLEGNAGVGRLEDPDNHRLFFGGLGAFTLTANTNGRLQPFVDTGIAGPEAPRGGAGMLVDGGATYLVNDNLQVDFSLGAGVAGETPPDFFWSVGLSQRFGAGRRHAAAPPVGAGVPEPSR